MSRFFVCSLAAVAFIACAAPAAADRIAPTASAAPAEATISAPEVQSAYDFTFFSIDGKEMPLSAYRGKVLLVVNTATGCGFAGQFRDLQKLQDTFGKDGLVVIGVPSNDFGGQEPLDGEALQKAVTATYGAAFVLTQKTAVSGAAVHPFYVWAGKQNAGGLLSSKPRWNFHKYLIGRDGRVRVSAGPTTGPLDNQFVAAIKAALSEKEK